MNTQTNSENASGEIPSLPSLFLHLYPSKSIHHPHITPKRRFLSPYHRSFPSPLETNSFTQSRFDYRIPFPFPSISFSIPRPLPSPSLPHLLFDSQRSNQIQSNLPSLPPPFPLLTPPSTHQHNLSQSNPSITLKVSSPPPHLHHPPPNPCFQPRKPLPLPHSQNPPLFTPKTPPKSGFLPNPHRNPSPPQQCIPLHPLLIPRSSSGATVKMHFCKQW